MVAHPTFQVLGNRGMLGSVVTRRWRELGGLYDPLDPTYVINCIRPDNLILSAHLAERGTLIQPSTDAINEDTDYAVGKRLLERLPAVTIRAGIVDVRHQLGVAYRNWRCNPLTPLEWADLAWDLRDHPGVHLAGREGMSRYEVADTVAHVFDFPRPIAAWADTPLNRYVPDGRPWPPLRIALEEYREWSRS